ncbi:SET and MYND domain-containing protein 4, partial [Pseudolycoriella hygida]
GHWQKESERRSALYKDLFQNIEEHIPDFMTMDISYLADGITESDLKKNNDKSIDLRNEGNKLYREGRYREAIAFYNYALCFAVTNTEAVAIAYGNRSAAYFAMQLYHSCNIDIALSLSGRCSKSLMERLAERSENCRARMEGESDYPKRFLPHLNGRKNNKFLYMNDDLEIQKNDEFGRCIVAKNDIEADCGATYYADISEGPRNISHSFLVPAMEYFENAEKLMKFVEETVAPGKSEKFKIPLYMMDDRSKYETFLTLWTSQHLDDLIGITYKLFNTMIGFKQIRDRFDTLEKERFFMHLLVQHAMVVLSNTIENNIGIIPSMMNHSCFPNVHVTQVDNKTVCTIIKPVGVGEQLFVAYVHPARLRIDSEFEYGEMHRKYGFRCKCFICSQEMRGFGKLQCDPLYALIESARTPTNMEELTIAFERCLRYLNSKMIKLNSFLCFDLKTGGQVIGWWSMLSSLATLLGYVILFITISCSDITLISEARACSDLKGTVGTIVLVVLGVLCPLIAYFGWKCVQGANARDHKQIRPLKIVYAIAAVLSILLLFRQLPVALIHLKTGGQFIGWWTMLSSLATLFCYVILFIALSCSDIKDSLEMKACFDLKGSVGTIVLVVLGVLCPLIAYFGWKCVQGANARDHKQIRPLKIVYAIIAVLSILLLFTLLPVAFVHCIVTTYCYLVLSSLYDLFKEESENGGNKNQHRFPVQV